METEVTIDPLPDHHTAFDIFSAVTDIENLIKLIVVKSNLYAQQKGRKFQTNEQEVRGFLGINYVMSINKLPTIKSYWECGQYVRNKGIRNVMSRSRFEEILQNLHFCDNTKDDKSNKGYKVRSLIDHFNQNVKNKPIKWGFNFWFCCASKAGYLYQLDLYLGKKEKTEENLSPSAVLKMTECLGNSYCAVFFDNFFNSPSLITKLYDRRLHGVGTARKDRVGMPEMTTDRKMRRGDHDYMHSDKVVCCKWFDRRSVLILLSNIEVMSTTSTVLRRQKGSESKIQVPCPDVIKMYSHGMGGVDLIDQRTAAYHLGRKSRVRFYLRIFFDLMNIACANSFVVFNMLHLNDLTLLDFKIIIATYLIGRYTSRSRFPPEGKTGSKRK